MEKKIIQDMENKKPELFVLPIADASNGDYPPVVDWFRKRYRHLPENASRGPFLLFMRRGGELEKRLTGAPMNNTLPSTGFYAPQEKPVENRSPLFQPILGTNETDKKQ
jgi:hypothetical protein